MKTKTCFSFLGKGGAWGVVQSTLVGCPDFALKTNWVKIHWCRVFQSVPARGENKCDKWARLNLHSRLITLQKQLAQRITLNSDGWQNVAAMENLVEIGGSKSPHIPFPISCINSRQSCAVVLVGCRWQSKPRYGRMWQNAQLKSIILEQNKFTAFGLLANCTLGM